MFGLLTVVPLKLSEEDDGAVEAMETPVAEGVTVMFDPAEKEKTFVR